MYDASVAEDGGTRQWQGPPFAPRAGIPTGTHFGCYAEIPAESTSAPEYYIGVMPPHSSPVVRLADVDGPADAVLVTGMQGGDEKALGLLYDRWESAVRTMALRILGDTMEADDVVEEVFWQAWRQADKFDASRGGTGTWLLTIARSRALDRRRARRRIDDAVDTDIDSLTEHPDVTSADNPLDAVERLERSQVVRAVVASLPTEQREAIQLAYYDGLSQSEIAARTGQPLGTVKTRVRLALGKLHDGLAVLWETTT